MIGLGVDLCEVVRIERQLRAGDAFLRRFYTEEERAYLAERGAVAAQSAAAMFAAKEAFLKALGIGLSGGVSLVEIGVSHAPGGQPAYALTGAARRLMDERGATRAHLSLTHDGGMAAAVCVLE